MKKQHRALSILLILALITLPGIAYAQTQGDQAKSSMQSAGTATKDAAKSVGSATVSGTKAVSDKVTGKIDINSASKADLMKLDGVGDAISTKIIAGRPYHTKRDLLTRKIVNQPTYNKISDKIIAHAGNSSTTAAK
jgi:DNA uptake protein ComE-like DNA-binding protein